MWVQTISESARTFIVPPTRAKVKDRRIHHLRPQRSNPRTAHGFIEHPMHTAPWIAVRQFAGDIMNNRGLPVMSLKGSSNDGPKWPWNGSAVNFGVLRRLPCVTRCVSVDIGLQESHLTSVPKPFDSDRSRAITKLRGPCRGTAQERNYEEATNAMKHGNNSLLCGGAASRACVTVYLTPVRQTRPMPQAAHVAQAMAPG